MDSSKLQGQVRSLTRDVGALREALRQEEKKRERLAAHAKACEGAAAEASARAKQLTYANDKLEQELRSTQERAEAAAAKGRSGLEALRGRLADVERSVLGRSAEAARLVQRLHSLLQELQAAAVPLAVATAARPAASALKSPLRVNGHAMAARCGDAQAEQLHRQFASVFGGLSQLAALFSGANPGAVEKGSGGTAPFLLTAPDGSKSVRWQDQSRAPSQAAAPSPAASSAGAPTSGGRPADSGPDAAAIAADAERHRLAADVRRLRAALAEAQQRAAAAEAGAVARVADGGRVQEAMKQLEAVVPQYRAAAQALQGQASLLKERLAAAQREQATLREEVAKWRGAAQRSEAALAEAAAQLHAREARLLAASTESQGLAERLQDEAEAQRRRCSELAAQLAESQRAAAEQQAALASRDKLAATQQQTIARLEATIQEQQADIRSALELVSSRPSMHSAAAAPEGGMHACSSSGAHVDELLGAGDAAAGGRSGLDGMLRAGWGSLSGDGGECGGLDAWASDVFDGDVAEEGWSIPAAGGMGGRLGSLPPSPAKPEAPKQQDPIGERGAQAPMGACPGLASLESDICGLEAALRTALGDLSL